MIVESGRALTARIRSQLSNGEVRLDDQALSFESRLIAEKITGDGFTKLTLNEYDLSQPQELELGRIISERNKGKPLAYIIHSTTFRNLDLYVDERVLIPRPETEIVVQHVVDFLRANKSMKKIVFDIGTGSGAIALSIANESPNAVVYASDISIDALNVAKLNAKATDISVSQISFFESNLFDQCPNKLHGEVDVIVSNPPYIGLDEIDSIESSVLNFEPRLALFSGEDGKDLYCRLISESKDWLKEDGRLVIEISPRHVEDMVEAKTDFGFSSLEIHKDLAGRDRIAIFGK